MTAETLDGKALAATIKAELKERVAALAERGIVPGLGTVLVGDDPGSHSYVRGKHRDCAQVGIASIEVELTASTPTRDEEAGALTVPVAEAAVLSALVRRLDDVGITSDELGLRLATLDEVFSTLTQNSPEKEVAA